MRTARAVSAGGVVLSEPAPDARVALVARRSARGELQWTLPKGTQETGETITETALREVREETGLEVELLSELDTIDYWFVWTPEETRWFPMEGARAAMAFVNERRLLDRIPEALERWSARR